MSYACSRSNSCQGAVILGPVHSGIEKSSLGQSSVGAILESGDDTVLVDVGEDVRSADEDADSSSDCHGQEDVQL